MKLTNNTSPTQTTYTKKYQPQNKTASPSFQGIGDAATSALGVCNAIPVVGVAVIDLISTIIPRTIIDGKTNGFAAAETFRRESSGLLINCILPSFLVLGVAKVINNTVMGKEFANMDTANSWVNEETLNVMKDSWKDSAKNNTSKEAQVRQFVDNTLNKFEALDGKEWKSLSESKGTGEKLTDFILNPPKHKEDVKKLGITIHKKGDIDSKKAKKAFEEITSGAITNLKASTNIRYKDNKKLFCSNLTDLLRDTADTGRKFSKGIDIDKFSGKLVKLIKGKSAVGMAGIIVLAMSMQKINRLITEKKSGQKGAPIYKDFGKEEAKTEMADSDKAKLAAGKTLSIGTIIGTSLLSMMGLPKLSSFQYKGMFPTVDQCRVVATATNVGRIIPAQDKNELRETTIRDIVCFSSLYFLGDYVAKGVATAIQKAKDVKLLNYVKECPKDANPLTKFGYWVKNTKVKGFDELATKQLKNYRSACELSSLGFSMAVLGIILPSILRKKTEAERAKELAKVDQSKTQKPLNTSLTMTGISKDSQKVFSKFMTTNQ